MNTQTALRLREMLAKYQQLQMLMMDAQTRAVLEKLIEDARSQLAKHEAQHPDAP